MRAAARIALLAGAAGSLGLVFYVGRHNPSRLLSGIFALWVLSPFAALAFAHARRPERAVVHAAMIAVAVGSVAVYAAVAFGPPRPRPAADFLVVPAVAWLITAAALLASSTGTHSGDPAKRK